MATIKGITIEIDGNTTGLSKALEGVNKNISSVNSELRQVNSLLKMDPGNAELIAQKQKLLSDAIRDTSSKLETLRQAKADADQQMAEGKINDEQYRALEREIVKAEQSLQSFNSELKNTDNGAKQIDFKAMASGMGDVAKVAGNVALEVGKVVSALTVGLATAVAGVGAKMVSMSKESGAMADELMTLSAQTNISAETLQKWDYASKFIDTDVSTMTGAMAKMTKSLESNEDKFKSLGVAVKDSSGEFRSQEEIFMDSIDALGKIANETERDAMSMSLFGKSAQELNPLIKAGSEQLKALGDEAQNAGLVLGGEVLQQFGSFDDTMQRMDAKMTGLKNNITKSFMPAISGMAKPIENAMGEISSVLADGLQEGDVDIIGELLTGLIENLSTQITELVPKIVDVIIPAISGIVETLVKILPTILPVLLNGVIALLQGLLTIITQNIKPLIDMAILFVKTIADFLIKNLPLLIEAGLQIILALVNGIVEYLPELIPTIIDIVIQIVTVLLDNLPAIITAAIQIIVALIQGLLEALPKLIEFLPTIIEKTVEAIIEALPILLVAAIQIILALGKYLILSIPRLLLMIPKIIIAIVNGLISGVSDMMEVGGNLVEGLWIGIKDSFTWIKNKITGWVGDVLKFIKKLFGIASPSKVMQKQVGLNLGLGIAQGIEDSVGAVKSAMGDLGSEINASVNPIINPTANSNPLILNIENFNNTRQTDVQAFMEEAEFYRKQTAIAKGGN